MIWGGRRDFMEGDMNILVGMPPSPVIYPRGLLVWLFIQIISGGFMLRIIGDKSQDNMSAQRTLREAIKLWRLKNSEYGRICIPQTLFYNLCHCKWQQQHTASRSKASINRCPGTSDQVIKIEYWWWNTNVILPCRTSLSSEGYCQSLFWHFKWCNGSEMWMYQSRWPLTQ